MPRISPFASAMTAVVLAALGGGAISAQDRDDAKVPDGLALADFKGYQDWQTIAVSQAGDVMAAILGNPVMIEAYRSGFPGNGKPVPDGARIAKIHWHTEKSAEAPAPTIVPGALKDVDFMVKDSRRFAGTAGWGYAQFNYDAATDRFVPEGTGAACGAACHTIAQAKDSVFTAYPKR
jgi:hypothetical protein